MKKYDVINRLTEGGVVAVVRAENSEQAVKIAEACIDGGIKGIEVTFTVPHAEKVIAISKSFNIDAQIVGRIEEGKKSLTIKSEFGEFNY